jgi:flagellar biosynthesis protein FlhF
MDEAITTGGVLNIAMQYKLPVHYTTNGQRVPQDIALVDASALIAHAFEDGARRSNESEFENDDVSASIRMSNLDNSSIESTQHV